MDAIKAHIITLGMALVGHLNKYDYTSALPVRNQGDRGGAQSVPTQPRRGPSSHVQPLEDLGEPSAQPWEHKMG
jgi:hypothetical protein